MSHSRKLAFYDIEMHLRGASVAGNTSKMARRLMAILSIPEPQGNKKLENHVWSWLTANRRDLVGLAQQEKNRRYRESRDFPMPASSGQPPLTKESFYRTWEWRELRIKALLRYGRICMCCGAVPGSLDEAGVPVTIQVDHIKPVSRNWNLRLDPENLQILCNVCNQGKGAWDETDYRGRDTQGDSS